MKTVYVNGERLDPAEIAEQLRRFEDGYRQQLAESMELDELERRLAEDALENVIDDMLLSQAAQAANLVISDGEVKQRFSELKRDAGGGKAFYERSGLTHADDPMIRDRVRTYLRRDKYLAELGRDVPRPSDDECREVYDQDPGHFVLPEMILASRMVQESDRSRSAAVVFADMMNIRQAILDGADFAMVAKMVSDDPNDDGNLGYLPRGHLEPAFDRVAFALEAGEVSDVFQIDFRYVLVKVFDRRAEEARDFLSVCDIIRDRLWEVRKSERVGQEADALRKAADVRIEEESP